MRLRQPLDVRLQHALLQPCCRCGSPLEQHLLLQEQVEPDKNAQQVLHGPLQPRARRDARNVTAAASYQARPAAVRAGLAQQLQPACCTGGSSRQLGSPALRAPGWMLLDADRCSDQGRCQVLPTAARRTSRLLLLLAERDGAVSLLQHVHKGCQADSSWVASHPGHLGALLWAWQLHACVARLLRWHCVAEHLCVWSGTEAVRGTAAAACGT